MSHNNQRSHPPSTSSPQTFSEVVTNLISVYETALPKFALVIHPERNSGLDLPEIAQTLSGIYEKILPALTSEWFKQEDQRLQQRGRQIVKDTLILHRIIDPRGAEAAVEKYHLGQFLD